MAAPLIEHQGHHLDIKNYDRIIFNTSYVLEMIIKKRFSPKNHPHDQDKLI